MRKKRETEKIVLPKRCKYGYELWQSAEEAKRKDDINVFQIFEICFEVYCKRGKAKWN